MSLLDRHQPRQDQKWHKSNQAPVLSQSHPYLTCFDMKRACPDFACVQIASWLLMPNSYVDVILDKPVHSFHDTANLRSSGYGNEARAQKCNDLFEPANDSSRHQASFWNAVYHCMTLNCKQTWRFCGDAWSHYRRDTMRVATYMLASKVTLHSPNPKRRLAFVAAWTVFITLFTVAGNFVI